MAQTAADLEFGKRVVFAGPLADQGVKIRIAEGETFTDDAMGSLDWFVEGVLGSPK